MLYGVGGIGEVYAMKGKSQIAMLIDQVSQQADLQAGIDDLCKRKRRGIGLPGAGRDLDASLVGICSSGAEGYRPPAGGGIGYRASRSIGDGVDRIEF